MPWFNNTDAYNQASGWPREFMTYGQDQMRQWLDRMNRYGENGDWLSGRLQDYYGNMMNDGYASPEDIIGAGQRAAPWITDAINSRNNRMGQMNDLWGGRQTVDSAFDPIYGRHNDWAGDIGRTGDMSQGEIDRNARDLWGRNDSTSNDIFGGIRDTFSRVDSGINDTFGGLRRASSNTGRDLLSATNDAYGGLRADSGRTFGGLTSSLDDTFGGLNSRNANTFSGLRDDSGRTEADIMREIETLRPNSELSQARAARSWAPTVASTMQRLRSAGIGTNDLQGMSAMSDVEARRAAAMDDAAIEQNTAIADRSNQARQWGFGNRADLGIGELDRGIRLGLDQQEGRERLGIQGLLNRQGLTEREQGIGRDIVTDALGREIQLGIGQNDRSNTAAINALGMSNDERVRSLMNNQGISNSRTGATLDNLTNQYRMTTDWRNSLNDTDINAYLSRMRDLGGSMDMLREGNQNDLTNVGLNNQQYGMGNEWWQNQYNRRDAGAAGMGNLMNTQYGQRSQANQNAFGWGNSAMQSGDTARNYDANRGNIGSRILGGIAGPLLGMIPGVGPALQGGLSGFMGNYGGTGNQGGWGGGYGGATQRSGGGGSRPGGQFSTPPFVPRYSNSASFPQVQNWNNLSQNLFGNLRIP